MEDKKNKIKDWLRETLKSPAFLELAKKKLKQAGFSASTRRTFSFLNSTLIQYLIDTNTTNSDDRAMDESNLSNQINEQIIEADSDNNESEKLLRTLALQEVMLSTKGANNSTSLALRTTADDDGSIESLIAYITAE